MGCLLILQLAVWRSTATPQATTTPLVENERYSNLTGSENTANGREALFANITGGAKLTASGYQALYSNATGYENTASGWLALYCTRRALRTPPMAKGRSTAIPRAIRNRQWVVLGANTTGYQNTAMRRFPGTLRATTTPPAAMRRSTTTRRATTTPPPATRLYNNNATITPQMAVRRSSAMDLGGTASGRLPTAISQANTTPPAAIRRSTTTLGFAGARLPSAWPQM